MPLLPPLLSLTVTLRVSPLASIKGVPGLFGSIFLAAPVMVGVRSLVTWLFTVGTSAGAMLTSSLLLVSGVAATPATLLTLALTG